MSPGNGGDAAAGDGGGAPGAPGDGPRAADPGDRGAPVLEVRDVRYGYDDEPALEDVSFEVRQRDFLAILGPNGGGKTTLLKVILGLLEPWSGTVRRHLPEGGGALGYVPQFATFDRHFPARVRDVVLMGRLGRRGPFRRYRRQDHAAAEAALRRLGLEEVADRHVGDLSGGQLQRTLVARAVAGEPAILLLDEPLASVDTPFRRSLVELLRELNGEMPVVVVTHDLTPFAGTVKQVACINRRLHYHPEGRVTGDMLEEVYGCPVELVAHGVPHRVLAPHDDGPGTEA